MASYGSLPFAEQIAFFLGKDLVPTARWTDVWQSAHDRAFMVAGAQKADLLADLHAAVLAGIEGGTLADFRTRFDEIVARHGWTGWTGEGTATGRAWRTRVIYETNLVQSYNAGRWAQIDAVRATRPYVRRKHADGVLHPRPLHLAWDGMILRSDDPWVQEHPGFDGWGCRCRWFTLSEADLARLGKRGPDQAPAASYTEWRKPGTGETVQVPEGVDPGFGYVPGRTRDLAAELKGKAERYPPPLRQALLAQLDGVWPQAPEPPPVAEAE